MTLALLLVYNDPKMNNSDEMDNIYVLVKTKHIFKSNNLNYIHSTRYI